MAGTRVGTVTHYFDRIRVAAVALEGDLSIGDRVQFVRHGEVLFEQQVSSMQIEHQSIQSAKKSDEIGLKVYEEVREGTEVYKV